MNRATTLVLLLLVGGLAFFFFSKKDKPLPPVNPPILEGFHPAGVSELFFESLDRGVRANFRRVPGGWQLTQPLAYPAESAMVESFLSPLQHNTCSRVADLNLRPDLSLAPYGLEKPRAVIRVLQGGKDREVRIGSETLSGDQVFVLAENQLLQTSRNLLNATQRNLDELRAKEAFRIGFDAVREFEFWRGGEAVKFQAKDGLWNLEAPWQEPADSAQVGSFLGALAGIRVEKFFDDHPGVDAAYGLDPPMYRVILRDGANTDELRVGRAPSGDFVARRMDFPFVWLLKEETERLFQQNPGDFRNRVFFRAFRDQIEEIRLLTAAGEMVLVFKDGAWRLAAPREYRPDRRAVEDLLDQLQRLQVFEFPDLAGRSLADLGLDAPSLSVQVKAAREKPSRVLFGKKDETGKRYARRDGTQTALLVEQSSVPFLETSYLDYLDPVLLSFGEESLKRLEIVRRGMEGESKISWIRDAGGIWRRLGPDGTPGEKEDRKLTDSMDRFLFWKGKKALHEIPDPAFVGATWIELRYFQSSAEEAAKPEFVVPIWRSHTNLPITRGAIPVAWEVDSKVVDLLLGLFSSN